MQWSGLAHAASDSPPDPSLRAAEDRQPVSRVVADLSADALALRNRVNVAGQHLHEIEQSAEIEARDDGVLIVFDEELSGFWMRIENPFELSLRKTKSLDIAQMIRLGIWEEDVRGGLLKQGVAHQRLD